MNDYWRKIFGWSNSKENLFWECPKAFCFKYIAKFEGFRGNPQREKVRELGDLKSFPMWKGNILHEVLEEQIRRVKDGAEMAPLQAQVSFLRMVDEGATHPEIFVEVRNGYRFMPQRFEEAKEDGLEQLTRFFSEIWPRYEGRRIVFLEELTEYVLRVPDLGEVKVWAKVDLATTETGEEVLITDWKTGRDGGEAEAKCSPQLTGYILWFLRCHGVDRDISVEQVYSELVYLKTGNAYRTQRSQSVLDDLAKHIVEWSRKILDKTSKKDFPAKPKDWKCRRCNFATICEQGKRFIPAGG